MYILYLLYIIIVRQGGDLVPEIYLWDIFVRQGGDLVPEIYLWDKYSFWRIDGSNSQIEG